ncbi:MAG TPA: hypothetical protein VKT72_04180 [Candidatus Baltobacteraceae bacterium]|nr:hypothetical protein [Candidatus Baltobacteraceae bacterium]
MKRLPIALLALAMALTLAACGQKAATRSAAISPAPIESGPLSPMHGRNDLLATSPSELRCVSAERLWVNTHTHVYHLPGDPYYGRTKFGGYLCERDAVREGYRAAKK